MADQGDSRHVTYDGADARTLAGALGVPRVELFASIGSTLDAAHELAAAAAPDGTLVLADAQTAGRGRLGRSWQSDAGRGIWLTLVERPVDPEALDVLSLRIGLAAAAALDRFAPARVALKWPNDLYVEGRKLAGILVEARWKNGRLDWLAVGFGLNVRPPSDAPWAAALREGTSRLEVLRALVPALREAARRPGRLAPAELDAFASRDLARGRACREPGEGTVVGIAADGALLLDTAAGRRSFRAGSLVLTGDLP